MAYILFCVVNPETLHYTKWNGIYGGVILATVGGYLLVFAYAAAIEGILFRYISDLTFLV